MKVDYIALSVPVFFLLIGIELLWSFLKGLKLYSLSDAITNISCGIGQQLTGAFFKTFLFAGYIWIYENLRIATIQPGLLQGILLFIGVDFFYYWFHRMSHEINAIWATHIVHHQSEEYNLTVALRQSWFQAFFSNFFYLPLAWIGFDPITTVAVIAFNTLYQFWIHTELIKIWVGLNGSSTRLLTTACTMEAILNTSTRTMVEHLLFGIDFLELSGPSRLHPFTASPRH
jgi:sterol desaturase/sphingolipid hydroxylase (fatty acid hydroxylase superfamily)